MSMLAALARSLMLSALVAAALVATGCRMYPAGCMSCGGCTACGCGGCASCGSGGMPMAGHGHGAGCGCGGGGLAAQRATHDQVVDAGPPPMPAPNARFHPVPTRPVFAQRGPTLATREVEVEYDVQQEDATARATPRPDRVADARSGTPRLARRPEGELPLEPAAGPPTPAAAAPTPARRSEPPAPQPLNLEAAGSVLVPMPSSTARPRRAVVSTFDQPATTSAPATNMPAAMLAPAASQTASDEVWRARLMVR